MIKRIVVKNFQSLRGLDIHPQQFTVIMGESDVGKSAIVRAIKAAVQNRPGTDIIRNGEDEAIVVVFTENAVVAWAKGKSAMYKVKRKDEDTEVYDKVGRSVPHEVQDALRMSVVSIGGENVLLNVHDQFDPPFLIVSPALTRAKLLGEVSGVNILYLAAQEARGRDQRTKVLRTTRVKDLESARTRLKSFQYLTQANLTIQSAESKVQLAQQSEKEADRLSDFIDDWKSKDAKYWHARARAEQAEAILSKVKETEDAAAAAQRLFEAINSIKTAKTKVSSTTEAEKEAGLKHAAAMAKLSAIDVCPTCGSKLEKGQLTHEVHADK